jgi:nitric oxide reductase NorD protein
MYGMQFDIKSAQDIAPRNLPGARRRRGLARHDGITIELPAAVDARDNAAAIAQYRLLAIEQAARIIRGSTAHAPSHDDPVARDLYNIREAAEIDAAIVAESPGISSVISEERSRALRSRPPARKLSERERAVENMLLDVLGSDPGAVSGKVPNRLSPAESLAWARETARSISTLKGDYRSLPPVSVWGETLDANSSGRNKRTQSGALVPPSPGYGSGESNVPGGGGDGAQEVSPLGTDIPQDEADQQADPEGVEVTGSAAVAGPGEAGTSGNTRTAKSRLNATDAAILAMAESDTGILYPEWDCNSGSYRELGAVVHVEGPAHGAISWAENELGKHPAVVRRIRREFERLRARRARFFRQVEGDELDIAACVRALADAAAGNSSEDRLYVSVRPARRPIAITVLVDMSASTRDLVADGRRIIDVEKTTVLLAGEAFDALGDSYSILAFTSDGAPNVRIATVKNFRELNGETVHRRIAALEPGGNTRLGAAIRHATAQLSEQHATHRLLLILSDGKPNDIDRYFPGYAVEDSRQAIFEAKAAGIYPFCLTVDSSDRDEYLERVFGASGYSRIRRPEQLPAALLDLVRQLLQSGGR